MRTAPGATRVGFDTDARSSSEQQGSKKAKKKSGPREEALAFEATDDDIYDGGAATRAGGCAHISNPKAFHSAPITVLAKMVVCFPSVDTAGCTSACMLDRIA